MAEKDANNSHKSTKNQDSRDSLFVGAEDSEESCSASREQNRIFENNTSDLESCTSSYESPVKKEENPFSFKKFLNQDSSGQKNKGARKKVYPAASVTSIKSDGSTGHNSGRNVSDVNARVINTADVSSVLPDFVQDHLVIEQCYLSGSSAINIDNLNLQNLPDLNLEHQNVHFGMNSGRDINHSKQSPVNQFSNLPDFTLGVRNYQSGMDESCNSERLPDFTLNVKNSASSNPEWAHNQNSGFISQAARRRTNENESHETSHTHRLRAQMSSSPSVPLDLPSYDNTNESNSNVSIPFDLTIPADDKNCGNRDVATAETVSKSLPDFLSDGPIKKELDESFKCNRGGNASGVSNGLFNENSAMRLEYERLHREIDSLRCQLSEKNRRLEMLESELEHLHNTDQRETASLEYAFKEVESNLKQTTKRALLAEDTVLRLKQENKLLKSELCSLRTENMELRLGSCNSSGLSSVENKNQRIAKELRAAANMAETSLRTLLGGIENLRMIASSMDNVPQFVDSCDDCDSFLKEDSASGPAL